jgi:hypothetical protein
MNLIDTDNHMMLDLPKSAEKYLRHKYPLSFYSTMYDTADDMCVGEDKYNDILVELSQKKFIS